jgi:hypothetical protein
MKMRKSFPVDPFIATAVFGSAGSIEEQLNCDDSELDSEFDEQLVEPFRSFFERAQFSQLAKAAGVADVGWDQQITTGEGTLEKRESWAPGGILIESRNVLCKKGTYGYRLGVARVEERVIENVHWMCAFNAAGECVDVQEVSAPARE